jgi:hypothetical protein
MMAKACREKDAVLNAPIPQEHRQVVHSLLIELSKTNPWIRVGFISARSFRPNISKVENWIPSDSNYWS